MFKPSKLVFSRGAAPVLPVELPSRVEAGMIPLNSGTAGPPSIPRSSGALRVSEDGTYSRVTGEPVPASAIWRVIPEAAVAGDAADIAMSETSSASTARYATNLGFKSLPSNLVRRRMWRDPTTGRPAPPRPPRSVDEVIKARCVVKRRTDLSLILTATGRDRLATTVSGSIAVLRNYFDAGGGEIPGAPGCAAPGTPSSGAIVWTSRPGAALVAGPGGRLARGAALGMAVRGATVGLLGWTDAGAGPVVCDAGRGDVPVSVTGAADPGKSGAALGSTVGAIVAGLSAGSGIGTEGWADAPKRPRRAVTPTRRARSSASKATAVLLGTTPERIRIFIEASQPASASTPTVSIKCVVTCPERKRSLARIFLCAGIFVVTPTIVNSSKARCMRATASCRSRPHAITFARSES